MSAACPDCAQSMQPLFVDLPGKPDVELDRCARCGGLWLDFGEWETVTSRALEVELMPDAGTSRRCPRCTLTLTPAFLSGSIPIETCTACRGLWLDYADLPDIDDARLSRLARPPEGEKRWEGLVPEEDEPPPQVVGFVCASCQQRTPYSDARGTAKGLVCSRCTPQVQPIPRAPDFPDLGSRHASVRLLDTLGRFKR
ncbi:MAG: zf-TFIIB domain-containing protein [Myxococcota bacterium]